MVFINGFMPLKYTGFDCSTLFDAIRILRLFGYQQSFSKIINYSFNVIRMKSK